MIQHVSLWNREWEVARFYFINIRHMYTDKKDLLRFSQHDIYLMKLAVLENISGRYEVASKFYFH